jgi:hypothetical protein
MNETDVSLQIWLTQEEYVKLIAQKTTKVTWKKFLIEPLLNK